MTSMDALNTVAVWEIYYTSYFCLFVYCQWFLDTE